MARKRKRRKKTKADKKLDRLILKIGSADPAVVKAITDRLIDTYQQYLNEVDNTDFVDCLMAAHNFHTAVVCHLAETSGDEYGSLYIMAKDTFNLRMEKEIKKLEEKQTPEPKMVWMKSDYLH